MNETSHIAEASTAALPARGVVRIGGPDAVSFLDRMVTNDLEGIAPGESRFAALLSPQGKVLFEFIVVRPGEAADLVLDVAHSSTGDLVKRLTLYKLRAKIEIADVSADVTVALGVTAPSSYADPRAAALPRRAFVPARDDLAMVEVADHDRLRIAARVPELGRDYRSGEIVAHEALLDLLHGVSFTKGCYVGQEIVARMEHRGTARKRFVRVTAGGPLPQAGTEIRAGEALIGAMGSHVVQSDGMAAGLALLRLDRLAEFAAKGVPLRAGGIEVVPDVGDVAQLMPKAPDPIAID